MATAVSRSAAHMQGVSAAARPAPHFSNSWLLCLGSVLFYMTIAIASGRQKKAPFSHNLPVLHRAGTCPTHSFYHQRILNRSHRRLERNGRVLNGSNSLFCLLCYMQLPSKCPPWHFSSLSGAPKRCVMLFLITNFA